MIIPVLAIILLLPGHLFIGILLPDLLPRGSDFQNSPGIWAIPVTSISLVSLIGFILAIFGQLSEFWLLIIFSTMSVFAVFSPSVEINFDISSIGAKNLTSEISQGIRGSVFTSIFLASLLLGSMTVFFEIGDTEDPWMEFYITAEDGNIDSIPRNWSSSEPIELVLEVINHGVKEELILSKRVELIDSDLPSWENRTIVQSDFQEGKISLSENLAFSSQGEYLVQYNLIKSEGEVPFRTLQLWINYSG
jgi:uncharacterized membrane protein